MNIRSLVSAPGLTLQPGWVSPVRASVGSNQKNLPEEMSKLALESREKQETGLRWPGFHHTGGELTLRSLEVERT